MKHSLWVALLACALSLRAGQNQEPDETFADSGWRAVVNRATKADACILRVVDPSRGTDWRKRAFVEGKYKTLPEEVRTLVIWKLLDKQSYIWDAVVACIPTYNARVRFTSEARVVDVDFCFKCSIIRVLENGEAVGGGLFDAGSDWVFQAIATQFPRDKVVRDLKKWRERMEQHRLAIEMAKARDARKKTSAAKPPPPPSAGAPVK
jgi:hypothetical protein